MHNRSIALTIVGVAVGLAIFYFYRRKMGLVPRSVQEYQNATDQVADALDPQAHN